MDTIVQSPLSVAYKKTSYLKVEKSLQPRIFLIGMPGVGKTFWAETIRRKIKVPAYDLDKLVEVMEERTIEEIFLEEGEAYFRKAESRMLRLFEEKKQFILSTGGGTPCFDGNIQWMNRNGLTIWIDEPLTTLKERLLKEKENRPLIKNMDNREIGNFLKEKLDERKGFYEMATIKVNGNKLSESSLIEIIKQHV